VLVSEHGLTITVEEARTLVGTWFNFQYLLLISFYFVKFQGMAFIFADIFDEYTFHPEPRPVPQIRAQPERATKGKGKQKQDVPVVSETESESDDNPKDSDWKNSSQPGPARNDGDEDESDNAAFEIPLNTLIECLNIFGTAGPSAGLTSTGAKGHGGRGWHRSNGNDADSDHEDRGERRRDGLEAFFGGQEKRTSMRMSYLGAGYPLTLIMWVSINPFLISLKEMLHRAEDASGPTTTCEITTFDSEPHLELDFDSSKMCVPRFSLLSSVH
jgi:cell cycle checkpoint protein